MTKHLTQEKLQFLQCLLGIGELCPACRKIGIGEAVHSARALEFLLIEEAEHYHDPYHEDDDEYEEEIDVLV